MKGLLFISSKRFINGLALRYSGMEFGGNWRYRSRGIKGLTLRALPSYGGHFYFFSFELELDSFTGVLGGCFYLLSTWGFPVSDFLGVIWDVLVFGM